VITGIILYSRGLLENSMFKLKFIVHIINENSSPLGKNAKGVPRPLTSEQKI
jgi:hypothetical protein